MCCVCGVTPNPPQHSCLKHGSDPSLPPIVPHPIKSYWYYLQFTSQFYLFISIASAPTLVEILVIFPLYFLYLFVSLPSFLCPYHSHPPNWSLAKAKSWWCPRILYFFQHFLQPAGWTPTSGAQHSVHILRSLLRVTLCLSLGVFPSYPCTDPAFPSHLESTPCTLLFLAPASHHHHPRWPPLILYVNFSPKPALPSGLIT